MHWPFPPCNISFYRGHCHEQKVNDQKISLYRSNTKTQIILLLYHSFLVNTFFFLSTVTITSFPCQESLNTVLDFPCLLRLNHTFSVPKLFASWFHAAFALIICMPLQDLGKPIHRNYNLLCIAFPVLGTVHGRWAKPTQL